jgi:hypothetical protein
VPATSSYYVKLVLVAFAISFVARDVIENRGVWFYLQRTVSDILDSQAAEGRMRENPIIPELPIQTETQEKPFSYKSFEMIPVADYEIRGKVLAIKHYLDAPFDPLDLGLGWGQLSDYKILRELKFNHVHQGDARLLGVDWKNWPNFDKETPPEIESFIRKAQTERQASELLFSQFSNNHLIPANAVIKKQLFNLKRGEIVTLRGHLVNVTSQDGGRWFTSTSRTDMQRGTGQGACEIMWVDSVTVD